MGHSAPAVPANMPQAISTRQNSFAIPYTIPVPKTPAESPAEIRLFVSSDLGKSWQVAEATRLNAITEPQRGQFTFRAPGDAEYWFAIRTVDRAGQLRGGRNGPELRVIVDSQPPLIKLDAQRGAAGEIAIRYEVTDAALQPQSLALSYQLAGVTEWRSVAFDKPFGAVPEKPLQGTTTFWPERAGVELLVKLEILDAAGNNGTTQVAVPIAQASPHSRSGNRSPMRRRRGMDNPLRRMLRRLIRDSRTRASKILDNKIQLRKTKPSKIRPWPRGPAYGPTIRRRRIPLAIRVVRGGRAGTM